MNSKELFKMLENMETTELKRVINAGVSYLVFNRKVNFKEFMKEIKTIHKELRKLRGKENE